MSYRSPSPAVESSDPTDEAYCHLITAIIEEHSLREVQQLVRSNPDLLRKRDDENGFLPLHFAVSFASLAMIRCLLDEWEQALHAKDRHGYLPLHFSAANSTLEVVQVFAERYPKALRETCPGGWLPIHLAAQLAPLPVVRLLVGSWPDSLQVHAENGWLPCHVAVNCAPFEVVQFLVDKCPDALQRKDKDGCLPLHYAAKVGTLQVVQYLVDKCPLALESRNNRGELPLQLAAKHSLSEVVEYLVDKCAQANDGVLPMSVAAPLSEAQKPHVVADECARSAPCRDVDEEHRGDRSAVQFLRDDRQKSQEEGQRANPTSADDYEHDREDVGERHLATAKDIARQRRITMGELDGDSSKHSKRRSSKQPQFWSNTGIQAVDLLCRSFTQQGVFAKANFKEDVVPHWWTYQFRHRDALWADKVALCTAWLFPSGAPSSLMERLSVGVLQILSDDGGSTDRFRLEQITCFRSNLVLVTRASCPVANSGDPEWLQVEILLALVDRESAVCVSTHEMADPAVQRLILCAKGYVGDAGRPIRSGGYDQLLSSIRTTLTKVYVNLHERVPTERLVCPECLQTKHPKKASTLSEAAVVCTYGHGVDTSLICSAPLDSMGTTSKLVNPFRMEPFIAEWLRSVVVVAVFFADGNNEVGSGFVADSARGFILAAAHTAKHSSQLPITQILIGVKPENADGVEFRYTADVALMGSANVDACVLLITGRFNDASRSYPLLSDLLELHLSSDSFMGENVFLVGYNQGGEGVVAPGTILDERPDVLRGYVCKFFTVPMDGVIRKEIVVDGGQVFQGHSGAPCLNAGGTVLGILSRSDCYNGQRWYNVPHTELRTLLQRARELCHIES
jgi:ankyrin repeat protein